MAELHDLKPSQGSTKNRKRVGRGPGSGTGKTSGRGHKGQGSRSGGSVPAYFEGGQMPLIRRIPKRGFKNIHRVEFQVVNVRDLERCDGAVDPEALKAVGLVASLRKPVKILGEGEIAKKLDVSAHKFSKSAVAKIEAAGGSVTWLGGEPVAEAAPAKAAKGAKKPAKEAPVAEAAAAAEAVTEQEEPTEAEAGSDDEAAGEEEE